MTDTTVIRVRDLRTYLNRFPEDAVVLRDIGDANLEGAYVDLNLAMSQLEQEHGAYEIPESDSDDEIEHDDATVAEDEDHYDPDEELQEARDLTRDQERSIAAWEKAQQ